MSNVDLFALGLLVYGFWKCTPTEIWEWVKSMVLMTLIGGVLFIAGCYGLFWLAS